MCNLHLYSKDKKSRSVESLKQYCRAVNAKSMAARYLLELPVMHEPSSVRGHHRLGKEAHFDVRLHPMKTDLNPLFLWNILGVFKKGKISIRL